MKRDTCIPLPPGIIAALLSHLIHTSQCGNSGDEEDEEDEEQATATFFLRRFFLCCFAAEGFSHSRDVFVLVSVLSMLIDFLPRRRFDGAFFFFACVSLAANAVLFFAPTALSSGLLK